MDAPPVQYITTPDGHSIAYAVSGEGRSFVFMPQSISHIQLYWTQQTFVYPWLEGLAARFQLIQYDGRGQGMSSRGLAEDLSMRDLMADFEAIIERLGLDRFVIMAVHWSGHAAIRYALQHPDWVEALILVSSPVILADWSSARLQPLADQDWDAYLRTAAGLTQASDISASIQRQKQTVSQADWRILMRAAVSSSIEDLLPRLKTPTLVLHPRESMNVPPEESLKLAAAIPNARMVLIDGANPLGDHLQGLKAIDDFLASLPFLEGHERTTTSAQPDGLSSREIEVLRLIAAGKSNQQIADELVISLNTVQHHVGNILSKTGAVNRTEAAGYARDRGLTGGD
jgi:pimeloyl-ACP methyl ester carboxylesterase/DNA-binding CsgD family transcriptional regulator